MDKIRKQYYVSPITETYLKSIKEKNKLRTEGDVLDFVVRQLQEYEQKETLNSILKKSLEETVTRQIRESLQPLLARTQYADKSLKILINAFNHYTLFAPGSLWAGAMATVNDQKSKAYEQFEQRYKEQIEHFKQNSSNKKERERLKDVQPFEE